VKTALVMARLSTIKTLAGFDFTFQPSLDRNRVLALAQLDFVDRHEVVHLLGPPDPAPFATRYGQHAEIVCNLITDPPAWFAGSPPEPDAFFITFVKRASAPLAARVQPWKTVPVAWT
jgi:hypothetical protein